MENENEDQREQAVPDSPPIVTKPKSPPKSKKKYKVRSANLIACHIVLLDGTIYDTKIDKRGTGQVLFDDVCAHLDILEKNYFGLSFKDASNYKQWLVDDKKIAKQIKGGAWAFDFELKFYPVEPIQMHEDLTRYLLCLQVRIDILNEKLPCSFTTQSLLGSYAVQSELGDYTPEEHGNGIEYIRDFQFIKNQDDELLNKISELHQEHKGQTPAQADLKFLESAKKLMFYGVELHEAKDWEGLDIGIGICARGVLIFQGKKQINRFAWPKVLKISYRRCNFILKIRPGEFERFEATVFFKCENSKLTKRLWKSAIEQHTFFRWKEPLLPKKNKIFKLGSKHRYSGRTQFQTRQEAITEDRPNPQFERAASKRSSFGSRSASMNDMHFTSRRQNDMYKPIERRAAEAPSAFKFNGVPGQDKPRTERDDNTRRYREIDIDDERNNIEENRVIIKQSETETKYRGVPTPLASLNEADKRRTRRVSDNSEDEGPISRSTPVKLTPPTIRRYSISDDDDIPDKIAMEREEKPKGKDEHKNGKEAGKKEKEKDKKRQEKEKVKKAQLVTEVDL